jgi:glycosyltransferase involved in cell wall biosynthesis
MTASLTCDVVFLQRELLRGLTPWAEELISKSPRGVIFDFDDAIWLRYPSNGDSNPIAKIIRASRAVVVGNEYLASYAKLYNPNVYIVPTPIDTLRIRPGQPSFHDGLFRIGWTGSASTLSYLYELVPVFEKLRSLSDRIILSVICDKQPKTSLGLPVEFLQWSPQNEVMGLQLFDVGIMPLPDNGWTRGKCSFKLLQYLAAGLPAVVAPVGMNIEVLGKNTARGIMARTVDEWLDALQLLYREPQLRQELGTTGRKHVEEHFDLRIHAEKLARIIRQNA